VSGTRIAAIDFVRGVALLGILTINVTGFWGPTLASFSRICPMPKRGRCWFLIAFVLFEGKMRALFTLLFGASMLLFIEAAERRGARGAWMQARRLLWLALFGYAHYLLLWWGDSLPMPCAGSARCCSTGFRRAACRDGSRAFLLSHGLDTIGAVQGLPPNRPCLRAGLAADRIDEQDMMMRIAASLADDRGVLAPFLAAIRLRLSRPRGCRSRRRSRPSPKRCR
jgi:uncharacterized protein